MSSYDVDERLFDHAGEDGVAARSGDAVERGIALLANLVWAVVGFVLWVPLVARAVVVAAGRVVHGALTGQSSDDVRSLIRRTARFYTDGFLRHRAADPPGMYTRRREFRLGQFLAQGAWIVLFYALVLSWLAPEWLQWLGAVAGRFWGGAVSVFGAAWGRVGEDGPQWLQAWTDASAPIWWGVGLLVVLAACGGWWLSRR